MALNIVDLQKKIAKLSYENNVLSVENEELKEVLAKKQGSIILNTDEQKDFLEVDVLDIFEMPEVCRYLNLVGVYRIGDLVQCTETELLQLPRVGQKAINFIEFTLCSLGFKLGTKIQGWPEKAYGFTFYEGDKLYDY